MLSVETPDTLNCLVNKVFPITVVIPAKVETPATINCPVVVVPTTSNTSLGAEVPIPTVPTFVVASYEYVNPTSTKRGSVSLLLGR